MSNADLGDEGRLKVLGVSLEYRWFGPQPDAAPTIVMLHEGLGSVSLWRDFPEALVQATGWGVFAFSRQGYGQSDPAKLPLPIDYMTREAMEVLPHVLDQIGFNQGMLLGHSDGASIAAIYAGRATDQRLEGIVLLAPHFFTEAEGLASIAEAKVTFETTDLPQKMARHHKNADNAFHGWNGAWLNPEFAAWNIENVIGGIQVPVLAIQGLDDQYGTLAQLDALSRQLRTPFERIELRDCRHAPQFESAGMTLAAVTRFVAGYGVNADR